MSDIDVLDTNDECFQDSGFEYLPYDTDRSSNTDEVDNNESTQEVDNNEIIQEVDNNEITQDTVSGANTGPTNLNTCKRLINKNNWKKNVRKSKRARGDAYIGTTGKCVPAKTFKPYVCSCLKKCNNFINEVKQKKLHTQYYDLGNYDLQSAFIAELVKKINKKGFIQKMLIVKRNLQ